MSTIDATYATYNTPETAKIPSNTADIISTLNNIIHSNKKLNEGIEKSQELINTLQQSKEFLELTTCANEIGLWEYIIEKDILIWNETMFLIYNRNSNFFNGSYSAWRQCVHPDDIEKTERLLKQCKDNLSDFICKFRIILPDGNIKYILAKAKVEKNEKLNQHRVLGTNIDITQEELTHIKLHNLELLRSSIVEYSEDGIISKTPYGIITSWNTGAENIFGYTAEEAIGKPIRDLLFPENRKYEEDIFLEKVNNGKAIKHFKTERICKNGRIIHVSITLSPIKDIAGNIVGISAIKRDISEFVKSEELLAKRKFELEHINIELEKSNKDLEAFAYIASHDLKSPLRGISQLSTWIEEDLQKNDHTEVLNNLALLRNRIQRMEKLLDDLLIYYRAGKKDSHTLDLNVREMARDIFDIQNTKPDIQLNIIETPPVFSALSTPFEQVLRNLFSNAIKHHDKEHGTVSFNYRNLNSHFYEFSVCDDGPGIPTKFQQRVFGMFQTLKPRDELEGSGMGLALIKKIITSQGGYITLKSEGRGCCFRFSWPKHIERSPTNEPQ